MAATDPWAALECGRDGFGRAGSSGGGLYGAALRRALTPADLRALLGHPRHEVREAGMRLAGRLGTGRGRRSRGGPSR